MADSPFSTESLNQSIERYFEGLPPHHLHAQVEYRVEDGSLRIEVATRLDDHWRVGGSLAWNLKTGRLKEGSVRIMRSW